MNNQPPEEILKRDQNDPLATFRDRFELPDGVVYLDGNSLGALPRSAGPRLQQIMLEEWGRDLINGWSDHGWLNLNQRIGDRIAKLIGAGDDEVIIADSTTINIFKMVTSALEMRAGRKIILTEDDNFPTDLYILESVARLAGDDCIILKVPRDDLLDAIDDQTAVVVLTQVNYRTSAILDMAAITEKAHTEGALTMWDLSHSAGALPVDLNGCDVDFAVGCGYKYLNGGPGAPAYIFAAHRHQDALKPALAGWMGHSRPFDFSRQHKPADGIRRTLTGTPAILALAALEEGVKTFDGVDMYMAREKSMALTDLFIDLVEQKLTGFGIRISCPRRAEDRGNQVTFSHPQGDRLMQALIDDDVIGDFRAPETMRFGMAPLYVRYEDIWLAVKSLYNILENEIHLQPKYDERHEVT